MSATLSESCQPLPFTGPDCVYVSRRSYSASSLIVGGGGGRIRIISDVDLSASGVAMSSAGGVDLLTDTYKRRDASGGSVFISDASDPAVVFANGGVTPSSGFTSYALMTDDLADPPFPVGVFVREWGRVNFNKDMSLYSLTVTSESILTASASFLSVESFVTFGGSLKGSSPLTLAGTNLTVLSGGFISGINLTLQFDRIEVEEGASLKADATVPKSRSAAPGSPWPSSYRHAMFSQCSSVRVPV
jgi:hypothetical protein